MLKKIISATRKSLDKLTAGFKRFPEAITLAIFTIIILIILNHLDYRTMSIRNNLNKLAAVLALGIPLSLIIRLLFEKQPKMNIRFKIAFYLGVILGLILYYLYGLNDFTMVPLTRYIALSIAGYLIFLFTPYFYKRENFELYSVQALTGFVITYFYAAVLYLGLSAILFTIQKLFLITWENIIYYDVWLIVAGIFAPAYFLAEIPSLKSEMQISSFSKVLKVLFLYIVIPMMICYSLILYIYFAKVILAQSWPAGIVAPLVLWFGLICSGVFFCIYPLRFSIRWLDKLLTLFPGFLFPLLAMMFVALGIRIHAYGITESRYFVLLAGLWITFWMLYYLFAKKIRNIILPISLALLAILSVIGPWSAYSISKFDQNLRFTKILKKYDMFQKGKIIRPSRPIATKEKAQIIGILSYFKYSHSLKDVKYLPDNFKLSEMPRVLGFKVSPDDIVDRNGQSYFNYQFLNSQNNQLTHIEGFDYFIANTQSDIIKADTVKKLRITYTLKTGELEIRDHDREIYLKKVSALVIPFCKKGTPPGGEPVTYLDDTAKVKVFYQFNTFSGQRDAITDVININYLDFVAFIKLK